MNWWCFFGIHSYRLLTTATINFTKEYHWNGREEPGRGVAKLYECKDCHEKHAEAEEEDGTPLPISTSWFEHQWRLSKTS